MQKLNDFSRSLIALEPEGTLIAVIEMSLASWLVAGIVPGVERQPLKKLAADENALLKLLHRWRAEAEKAGRRIKRIAVAFEAGRDGFWLARWLKARNIEAHVIHAASVAVSREHRRAKTDRLDTELLKRAFLGWLRGERDHCKMVAIPSIEDEDAKRLNRERENLVSEQSRIINRMKAALIRLGIRAFNPKLKKAAGRLEDLRTPEDEPIPPNTLAELRRDMERRRLIRDQIRQIEEARLERLDHAPSDTLDPASRFLRLRPPAMQQLQQCVLVCRKLLQRLAFDARYDAGNEPARQTRLNHSDQCALRFESDEGSAKIVQLLHRGPRRFTLAPMDAISSPPPHSISLSFAIIRQALTAYRNMLCREPRAVQAPGTRFAGDRQDKVYTGGASRSHSARNG
jgi:transposase